MSHKKTPRQNQNENNEFCETGIAAVKTVSYIRKQAFTDIS